MVTRSLIGSFVSLDLLRAFLRANDGNRLRKFRLFGGEWHGGLLQHLFDCGQLQGLEVSTATSAVGA
jgi:hypothetical protein